MPDSKPAQETILVNDFNLDSEYIDAQCMRLLDRQFFSHLNGDDMQVVLKYMKQRHLYHALVDFSDSYKAVVVIPTDKSIKIIATAKSPTTAIALLGVKMAELAGL